jgi:dipeptidyl aminopeptidase/acylaminoacyl peptidase
VSSDGTKLAIQVVSRPPGDERFPAPEERLYVIDTDGSDFRQLYGPVPVQGGRPQWTPDGDAIVMPIVESGSTRTMRVPLDGSPAAFDGFDFASLSESSVLPRIQAGTGRSLTISLDGRRMAFEVTTAPQVELWALDNVLELAGRRR